MSWRWRGRTGRPARPPLRVPSARWRRGSACWCTSRWSGRSSTPTRSATPRPDVVESGRVPGHEPAGVIAALGPDVRGWSVGDRVTVYFRRVCGQCHYCLIGRANVCLKRRGSYGVGPGLADGACAEQMVVDAQYLLPIPEDFSFEDAAIVACQGGTAYYPLSRLEVSGRDVLV